MSKYKFKIASVEDAGMVKELINQMYGFNYEVRDNLAIAHAINNKTEIYLLALSDDRVIGFSGASLKNDYYSDIITEDVAVIDYIYTEESSRGLNVSFELISKLFKLLVNLGVKQAIMQVQTFNKQRFFHYALSDKKIIKSTSMEGKNGSYYDQILLIEDLKMAADISKRELMLKVRKYINEDNSNIKNTY